MFPQMETNTRAFRKCVNVVLTPLKPPGIDAGELRAGGNVNGVRISNNHLEQCRGGLSIGWIWSVQRRSVISAAAAVTAATTARAVNGDLVEQFEARNFGNGGGVGN
jgi:hypothetical protein